MVTVATVLVSLSLPAPNAWANTDDLTPGEAAFVSDMLAAGIDGSDMSLVRIGFAVCNALNIGDPPSDVVASAMRGDDRLTPSQAWAEVRAAQRDMCPAPGELR